MVAVPHGVRPMSVGIGGGAAPAAPGSRRSRAATVGAQPAAGRARRRTAPTGRPGRRRTARASSPNCRGEQRRVVLRVPLGGQPVALDGVGEDHRGPGVVDRGAGRRRARRGRARRGCARRRAGSRRPARRPARRSSGSVAGQPLAQLLRRAAQQPLVLRVGHVVDALRAAPAPPGRVNSSCSSRPYLTVSTCQPAASNMPCSRVAPMLGTTRSSDCRLRSTIHTTSPSSPTIGSRIASQHAPSSSSASPTSEYCRPRAAASAATNRRGGDVPAGQRPPDRRGGPDADRAGGVVDRVRVLRPGSGSSAARRTRAASVR